MRIIAGKAGSLPLQVPKHLTRPTTDRVREAIFSSLGDRIVEAAVLDLFAGSGSLGLEALSRGAASATFVDSSAAAKQAIETNAQRCRLGETQIYQRDIFRFLSSPPTQSYQVIFADPPYATDEASAAVLNQLLNEPSLVTCLSEGGCFVLESASTQPLPETPYWCASKEKKYGSTRVSYLTPITIDH